jgi:mono/diheme cytochrome c family protein
MGSRLWVGFILLAGIALFSLAACGGGPEEVTSSAVAADVPESAANVANPVEFTNESVVQGAQLFAKNCAVCHGEGGEGDGPGSAGLDPPPANLRLEAIQANSDGTFFYVITNGIEGSAMPAWERTLSDEERWHLVNFIRSLAR